MSVPARVIAPALIVLLALAVAAVLGAGSTGDAGDAAAPPGVEVVSAAGGSPLARLPGTEQLAAHLARAHAARLQDDGLPTAVRPRLQRELVRQLQGRHAAGVVVDVTTGRLVAAAGAGGRSPWRSRQAPGAILAPVLVAGALDAGVADTATRLNGDGGIGEVRNDAGRRLGPLTLTAALATGSRTAIADVAARLDGWTVDALMRRVGFDSAAGTRDLAGLLAVSRGPALTPSGAHGVAAAPGLVDARGTFLDPGTRARATTFQLARLALALATAGRRSAIGISAPGPLPELRPWRSGVGATVRRLLAAATLRGPVAAAGRRSAAIAAMTGRAPDGDGAQALGLIAFAPADRPRIAVALTAIDASRRAAGVVLGPPARRLLELAVDRLAATRCGPRLPRAKTRVHAAPGLGMSALCPWHPRRSSCPPSPRARPPRASGSGSRRTRRTPRACWSCS